MYCTIANIKFDDFGSLYRVKYYTFVCETLFQGIEQNKKERKKRNEVAVSKVWHIREYMDQKPRIANDWSMDWRHHLDSSTNTNLRHTHKNLCIFGSHFREKAPGSF